jgi:hypothetical protein
MVTSETRGAVCISNERSVGKFRTEILLSEMRRARATNNGAAIGAAYVAVARKMMAEFPDLQLWERKMQLGILVHDIETRKIRTGQDCRYVVGALTRALHAIPGAV